MWSRRAERQLRHRLIPLLLADLDALPAFCQTVDRRHRGVVDATLLRQLDHADGHPSLLATLRAGPTVAAARRMLADRRRGGRGLVDAIDLVGRVRDTASRDVLLGHLGGADPAVGEACARALGRLGDTSAAPRLLATLDDEHPARPVLSPIVVEALVEMGPPVLTVLHHHRAVLRDRALLAALDASCRLDDPHGAALLNELLLRPLAPADLRQALVLGVGVGAPESHLLAPLATGHLDGRVRTLACRVLAGCPDALARAAIRWSTTTPTAGPGTVLPRTVGPAAVARAVACVTSASVRAAMIDGSFQPRR